MCFHCDNVSSEETALAPQADRIVEGVPWK